MFGEMVTWSVPMVLFCKSFELGLFHPMDQYEDVSLITGHQGFKTTYFCLGLA